MQSRVTDRTLTRMALLLVWTMLLGACTSGSVDNTTSTSADSSDPAPSKELEPASIVATACVVDPMPEQTVLLPIAISMSVLSHSPMKEIDPIGFASAESRLRQVDPGRRESSSISPEDPVRSARCRPS